MMVVSTKLLDVEPGG